MKSMFPRSFLLNEQILTLGVNSFTLLIHQICFLGIFILIVWTNTISLSEEWMQREKLICYSSAVILTTDTLSNATAAMLHAYFLWYMVTFHLSFWRRCLSGINDTLVSTIRLCIFHGVLVRESANTSWSRALNHTCWGCLPLYTASPSTLVLPRSSCLASTRGSVCSISLW